MPRVTIITRDGTKVATQNAPGLTLMEVIRGSGIDEVIALCGGCCSCATCHVHVDPSCYDRLPPMSEDERSLLDMAASRNDYSRLSCQLVLTDELDGIRLQIAAED